MFTGLYYHNIEIKGRLAIPQVFRKELTSGGVITRGMDGCLFLFPESSWQQLCDKLATLPLTSSPARNFTRLYIQSASALSFDSQGRTLLPEHLRSIASLKKQVVIAGALTRIEIWDRDLYHQHLDLIESQNQSIETQLSTLNL